MDSCLYFVGLQRRWLMVIGERGVEGFVLRKKGLRGGFHGVLLVVSMEELVRGRGSDEVAEAALIRDLRDGVRWDSTGVV